MRRSSPKVEAPGKKPAQFSGSTPGMRPQWCEKCQSITKRGKPNNQCMSCKKAYQKEKLYKSEAWKNYKRKSKLKLEFGISVERYDEMLSEQESKCANPGCRRDNPGRANIKSFAIDHCHKTGKIRGLLCFQCNVALGHLNDSEDKIEGLLQYLRRNKS